jgi:hypothetical protein
LAAHVLVSLLVVAAVSCSVKLPSAADFKPGSIDAAQVKALLHELFPSLSDDELEHYAGELDLSSAIRLEAEIADIRKVADGLSKALSKLASSAAEQRQDDLSDHNGGFPTSLEPVGRAAFYDAERGEGRIELSGVYDDHDAVALAGGDVSVAVAGKEQDVKLSCAPQRSVDIVLLVDITGSMTPVIGAVRRSLAAFVDAVVARHVTGTLSVVTFQDSVGVNVGFQEPAPKSGYERSPFTPPVAIDDAAAIADLGRFIARLEADSGADTPENLAGAIDFARSSIIGADASGMPNVIGEGNDDPKDVAPFPALQSDSQVFVAITDAPFHADSRTPQSSSLLAPFKPRPIADILQSLTATGTVVHVSDPSWVDQSVMPTGARDEVSIDSDYWAIHTGGLGEDRVAGYSLVDLDLLAVANATGLLDIVLDGVIGSSCTARFALPELSADATFDLTIHVSGDTFTDSLTPQRTD